MREALRRLLCALRRAHDIGCYISPIQGTLNQRHIHFCQQCTFIEFYVSEPIDVYDQLPVWGMAPEDQRRYMN